MPRFKRTDDEQMHTGSAQAASSCDYSNQATLPLRPEEKP